MPVIKLNLDDVQEMRPAAVGRYPLTIVSCEEVTSKKGKPQYDVSIAIDGRDDVPNIRHFISLPASGDEEKTLKFKVLMLKRFCALFGKPISGNSLDTTKVAMNLVGAKAMAEIGLDKETDSDGNEKPGGRVYNRLVVPYLNDESAVSTRATPPKR